MSNVMRFYSMTLDDIYILPLWTYWELAKNISRIQADDDMRLMALLQNSLAGKPMDFYRALENARGVVVSTDENETEKLDKSAFQQLVMLAQAAGQ